MKPRDRSQEPPIEDLGSLSPPQSEESLVPDSRAGLTPSQIVDRKLASRLGRTPPARPMGEVNPTAEAQAAARRPSSRETYR